MLSRFNGYVALVLVDCDQVYVGARADASAPVRAPRCIGVEDYIFPTITDGSSRVAPEVAVAIRPTTARVRKSQTVDFGWIIIGVDARHNDFILEISPVARRRIGVASRIVEALRPGVIRLR